MDGLFFQPGQRGSIRDPSSLALDDERFRSRELIENLTSVKQAVQDDELRSDEIGDTHTLD
jgi:hypothetical protein